MNTDGYTKGAKKVEQTQSNLAKSYERYSQNQRKLESQITKAVEARTKAEKSLETAIASNKSAEQINKIKSRIIELTEKEKRLGDIRRKNAEAMRAQIEASKKFSISLADLKMAALGVAGVATTAFFALKSWANEFDALGKRARDLNISADALHNLQYQAELAGVSAETLDSAMRRLARTGVSDAKAKMIELAEAAENGTLSVAEAEKYFGKSALEMIRILQNGKEAIQDAFNTNGIYAEAAQNAESFLNGWASGANKVSEFWTALKGDLIGAADALMRFESHETRYKRLQEERQKEEELHAAKVRAQEEQAYNERMKQIDEMDAKLEESRKSRWTDEQKRLDALNTLNNLEHEMLGYEQDSEQYIKLRKQKTEALIALEKIEYDIEQKRTAELKKQADEAKRKADAEAKQAAEELKRKAEEESKLATRRAEFDLQLKIRQLEAGSDMQKARAEALKNAIERNKLMREYGFTIEEATKRLKAQKELENAGKSQYSEADRKKAQAIVDRGATGSVGKRTLSQAQAILAGEQIQGDRVAAFSNATLTAKKTDFKVASNAELKKAQGASGANAQNASDMAAVVKKLTVLDEIKTCITQYFNTKKATNNA